MLTGNFQEFYLVKQDMKNIQLFLFLLTQVKPSYGLPTKQEVVVRILIKYHLEKRLMLSLMKIYLLQRRIT